MKKTLFLSAVVIIMIHLLCLTNAVAESLPITANCEGITETGLIGTSIAPVRLPDGTYRAYYMDSDFLGGPGHGGIGIATSVDGVTWIWQKGATITMLPPGKNSCNPWVFMTLDGRWRMIFQVNEDPFIDDQGTTHWTCSFHSAISTDGLNFTYEGLVMSGTDEDLDYGHAYHISVPAGIRLPDDSLRMYFSSGGGWVNGKYSQGANRSAVSTDDGLTWVRDSGTRLPQGVGSDLAIFRNKYGSYGLIYNDTRPSRQDSYVKLATSTDSLNFSDGIPILSTTVGGFIDPDTILHDNGRRILYFAYSPTWNTNCGNNCIQSKIYSCLLPADPIPNIKANGSDGPITIKNTDKLSVTVSLDPGGHSGENADWWVVAVTPMGVYSYNFRSDLWRSRLATAKQEALKEMASIEVLNMSGLPPGLYTFYFGVDMNMDGSLDMDKAYYDSINVTITE